MIKVFMTCECIAYRKEVTCKDTKDDNNSFFHSNLSFTCTLT